MLGLKQLRCSFCRKKDSQVEKLVAGPRAYTGARVYICDACVAITTQDMNEPPADDNASGVQLSIWRKVRLCPTLQVEGHTTYRSTCFLTARNDAGRTC